MNFLIRWLSTSIAVAAAVLIVPGITVGGMSAWLPIIIVGAVLGFINATLGMVVKIGTMPLIVLTLGIGNLLINAGMLYLSAYICRELFATPFIIAGFWPAFWGGVVISLVSMLMQIFLPYDKDSL